MNADRLTSRIVPAFILILVLAWTLPACTPTAVPTLFRPPSDSAISTTPPSTLQAGAPSPIFFPTQTFSAPQESSTPEPCTNDLTFVDDITYEDNTVVFSNQSIDKQWLVQNSGTCNWDATYRLVLVGGEAQGAQTESPLYPARAGAQATLRVIFSAPLTAGLYQSAWQAYAPDGFAFGDTIYVIIIVQ